MRKFIEVLAILICLMPGSAYGQTRVFAALDLAQTWSLLQTFNAGLFATAGTQTLPGLAIGDAGTGLSRNGAALTISVAGMRSFSFRAGEGLLMGKDNTLAWRNDLDPEVGADDVILRRDGPDILSLRRLLNAQEFRLENTFTDAANREFVSLGFKNNANVFTIETEALGTGVVRKIALMGGKVGIGTPNPNEGLEMGATLNVRIPNIKSTTGTRYVCVDINGTLVSSASACSGT